MGIQNSLSFISTADQLILLESHGWQSGSMFWFAFLPWKRETIHISLEDMRLERKYATAVDKGSILKFGLEFLHDHLILRQFCSPQTVYPPWFPLSIWASHESSVCGALHTSEQHPAAGRDAEPSLGGPQTNWHHWLTSFALRPG